MKRRFLCLFCSFVLLFTSITSTYAIADFLGKGNRDNYSYLSNIVIRESAGDFRQIIPTPKVELPAKSLDDIRKDFEKYKEVFNISYPMLTESYMDTLNKMMEMLNLQTLPVDITEMKQFLTEKYGMLFAQISDPELQKKIDNYTSILYVALKYDLTFPLNGTHVTIPNGLTPEAAIVKLYSQILSEKIISDSKSFEDFAAEKLLTYIKSSGLPVPENITKEQILQLYKAAVSIKDGHTLPDFDIKNLTPEDLEKINSSYIASIIKEKYGVEINPVDLKDIISSGNTDAYLSAILKRMLIAKGEFVPENATLNDIYQRALNMQLFKADSKFYSDVNNYDIYLNHKCDYIWVTPFAYAAEFSSADLSNLGISVNDVPLSNGRSIKLKIANEDSTFSIKLNYSDNTRSQKSTYTFTVHNGTEQLNTVTSLLPNIIKNTSNNQNKQAKIDENEVPKSTAEKLYLKAKELDVVPYDLSKENVAKPEYAYASVEKPIIAPGPTYEKAKTENIVEKNTSLVPYLSVLAAGTLIISAYPLTKKYLPKLRKRR